MTTFCVSSTAQDAAALPSVQDVVAPLTRAHAHNDYLHDRPLLDALSYGFCSVEADVFLVDGELIVGHTRFWLDRKRTLKKLYLDPLRARVKANGGRVYRDGPSFTLLIDIKQNGAQAFAVLSKLLADYDEVFSSVKEGKLHAKAVTVIISGSRPINAIKSASPRYAGIDGRLSDLDSDAPAHELPLISDSWPHHFRWRGEGDIYEEDKRKLKIILDKAHARGRRVRFWAVPDKLIVWKALHEAGVDLINTDKLKELSDFLKDE